MNDLVKKLKGQLIVSCQALENEPLHGSDIMARMAIAAEEGGAGGIRANSPEDIQAIRRSTNLPVIGLWKKEYEDSPAYITPTVEDARKVKEAGADIVAVDATDRVHPGGKTLTEFLQSLREALPDTPIMADISTLQEGLIAESMGIDVLSTTLSGYTEETEHITGFDGELLQALIAESSLPVVAEGKVHTPELAKECWEMGAHAVVVGSAITRPQEITKRFAKEVSASLMKGDRA
ncbi:N-acetylmannosamine-6-phosphate 2-epimerase [Salimicrobium halophilum]|uniref:Putative N-acetylmannosamine-6-phosphate 2-epimerase n=1 Tax=Salimicrobium halophilum TaxID=86666 RepID=A0A1G8S9L8_9BACI|nr:N-acetylmannosamine-6-phosphate 2-epimerase [Salimicrobium halophilum]SDJ25928.1 N-acylglucosamine-6-phosphate 2-epimerase [Salimicrobium halophilum]